MDISRKLRNTNEPSAGGVQRDAAQAGTCGRDAAEPIGRAAAPSSICDSAASGTCETTTPIKLILTDIDGTILPYGQTQVSARVISTFHRALDAGIRVGPATGRGAARALPVFANDVRCCETMLATNGMQVYLDGKLICEKHIELEPLHDTLELIRAMDHVGICYFEGPTAVIVHGNQADLMSTFPAYSKQVRTSSKLPPKAPVKANVFVGGDQAYTREVLDYLKHEVSGVDFTLSMPGLLNLTPPGWNKASGVDVLCEHLGISLEQVCVCGDADNDAEMLAHVPHSYAVAQASERARQAASFSIASVEDDGVLQLIEAIVNNGGQPVYSSSREDMEQAT